MPSLPTKNRAPECVLDAYRRYLPPSYRYSFELYIPNSFTNVFITYLKFLFRCTIYIMLILSTNFIFKYIENNIGSEQKYRTDGFTFIHDYYWFMLLSLYCFCFTFICYRQIPERHIHVRCVMRCFANYWALSLYLTSLFVSMLAFTIHYSLKALEWNKNKISSNHSLDKILTHWNIFCNIFICDDWTLSRFVTYLLPPITLFFNCFLLHYWLFGFHKEDKVQTQTPHQRIQNISPQKVFTKNIFHNSLSKSAIKSKTSIVDNDAYDDEISRISSIDIGNAIFDHGNDNKLMKSLPINASLSSQAAANNNNNLSIDGGLTGFEESQISQPTNKSFSPMIGTGIHVPKRGNTSSVLSGTSRSSPLIMNRSFIAFRYPEMKMLPWILLYCITFLFVNLIFNILSNIRDKWYNKYYVQLFIFILITTSCLKWVMKRIARMIDASRGITPASISSKIKNKINSRSTHDPLSSQFLRGININPSTIHTTYVSLELCTELYMDFVFFLAYRELMMYYIPQFEEFFKVSIYFFIHEFWICSIRPSATYYEISKLIQQSFIGQKLISCLLCNKLQDGRYHNYDDERSDLSGNSIRDEEYRRRIDPNYLSKRLLFFNWRDDCKLLQWQIRCSIDITLRILSGVICCVVIITEVLILGPKHFNLNKTQWIKGMQYIALSGSIQLIYFAIVYIWNFKVQNFPLLEPWCSLQMNNQATWNYVCVVSIAIAFWLPDL
eukprot:210625_1